MPKKLSSDHIAKMQEGRKKKQSNIILGWAIEDQFIIPVFISEKYKGKVYKTIELASKHRRLEND